MFIRKDRRKGPRAARQRTDHLRLVAGCAVGAWRCRRPRLSAARVAAGRLEGEVTVDAARTELSSEVARLGGVSRSKRAAGVASPAASPADVRRTYVQDADGGEPRRDLTGRIRRRGLVAGRTESVAAVRSGTRRN